MAWDFGTEEGEHNLYGPSHYEQKYLKLPESGDEKNRSSKSQNSNLTLFFQEHRVRAVLDLINHLWSNYSETLFCCKFATTTLLKADALTSVFSQLICGKPHQDVLLKYTQMYKILRILLKYINMNILYKIYKKQDLDPTQNLGLFSVKSAWHLAGCCW